jgi:alpha-galactosidase
VGELPPQLAALNNAQVRSLTMALDAALQGDREMLFYAIAYDPLTAAKLSLAEIRAMVDEIYEKEKDLLPMFDD